MSSSYHWLARPGIAWGPSCYHANTPQIELAQKIESLGLFDRVVPAFLNGDPAVDQVLEQLPPGDVVVIPLMTSEGYYSPKGVPGQAECQCWNR